MEKRNPEPSTAYQESRRRSCWPWVLAVGSLFVVLLALFLPRQKASLTPHNSADAAGQNPLAHGGVERAHLSRGLSGAALTPEEIVAGKVTRFAQDRLRITHAMAKRFKVSVAPDVERFFQAVAAGRWEELNAAFEALKQRRESGNAEDLGAIWGPILETLLIA